MDMTQQNLYGLFYDIYMLKILLGENQDKTAEKVAEINALRAGASSQPVLGDKLARLHGELSALIAEEEKLERMYLNICDTARMLIDGIDDDAVAAALRLHYVNGLNWFQTSLCTGVPCIRRKCREFLRKGGGK